MKLHCIIVDDEPIALDVLENHILRFPELILEQKCCSAFEAMDCLGSRPIDLIFLDIRMPRINGIEFLSQIDQAPLIIFTTAHRQFAVDGYDLNIVDFLLKPISLERFTRAIEKVRTYRRNTITPKPRTVSTDQDLFIRSGTKMVRIRISDILFIEGMRDYLKLHTCDGRIIIVKKTMKLMEKQLSKHGFIRIHKSFIVSTDKIDTVKRDSLIVRGHIISIGRSYKLYVRNFLNEKNFDS